MTVVYIGLGSNLNDPEQQLHDAIDRLQQLPDSRLIIASSFFITKPEGFLDQPDFMNAAACLETTLAPQDLLQALQEIEKSQGRVRGLEKNGPRTLDLDLLLYGSQVIAEPGLIVPHPRMQQRTFVLIPLLEIAPELRLPDGKDLKVCLEEIITL